MEIEAKIMDMLRPGPVAWGRMKVDPGLCNGCGLCRLNCALKLWEIQDDVACFLADGHCTSCHNCRLVCPNDAIREIESFRIEDGFYRTESIPATMPAEPKDATGRPDQYSAVEREILERRSVRNFKEEVVPEPLLRRVLEAGRFAPSGCNCQPYRFICITDRKLMDELALAVREWFAEFAATYEDDRLLPILAEQLKANPMTGLLLNPRTVQAAHAVADETLPVFLNAPVLILILIDERSSSGVPLQAGIAGQNMCLAANSLGLGSCWSGLCLGLNAMPRFLERLGIKSPWQLGGGIMLGYPAFKQKGMVPRLNRPVTWFRPGQKPQLEA